MSDAYPAKTGDFSWEKMEATYVLTDQKTSQKLTIDPISFLVWIQCDGKTSIDEIVDVLTVNSNRDIVKAAVSGVLEKLSTAGVIKWQE